jgi:hypothetical protein
MVNQHSEWRKFLQPVITGLGALLAAGAIALQQSASGNFESRLSVVENKVGGIDELRRDVTELSKNVYTLIGEIRAERRIH